MKFLRIFAVVLLVVAIISSAVVPCLAEDGTTEAVNSRSGSLKYLFIGAGASFLCVCVIDLIIKAKRKKTDENKK